VISSVISRVCAGAPGAKSPTSPWLGVQIDRMKTRVADEAGRLLLSVAAGGRPSTLSRSLERGISRKGLFRAIGRCGLSRINPRGDEPYHEGALRARRAGGEGILSTGAEVLVFDCAARGAWSYCCSRGTTQFSRLLTTTTRRQGRREGGETRALSCPRTTSCGVAAHRAKLSAYNCASR
jgi:hypothetical protein